MARDYQSEELEDSEGKVIFQMQVSWMQQPLQKKLQSERSLQKAYWPKTLHLQPVSENFHLKRKPWKAS